MRYLLSIFFLFFCLSAFSQGTVDRIELGYATTKRGIEWTRPGLPTHVPVWRLSRDTNTIIWHDKNTGIRYDWDYLTSVWYARGRFSSSLPPLPTQTSGLATIDNRTGFYLNASNVLHRYDITQTAWVPLKITYQSAAPTNVAAGVSNGAAVYTTTLWQDSDDFLIRYYDGDSWELIGGGTDLTFSGASSPVTLNSSTGTDVTFTAGTGISLAPTSTNTTITNSSPDQTVSITGAGINVVTGTYPNFTVTGTEVGTVGGTGVSPRLTIWSGTNTVTSNAAFQYLLGADDYRIIINGARNDRFGKSFQINSSTAVENFGVTDDGSTNIRGVLYQGKTPATYYGFTQGQINIFSKFSMYETGLAYVDAVADKFRFVTFVEPSQDYLKFRSVYGVGNGIGGTAGNTYTDLFIVKADGKFGILTTSPTQELDVNGDFRLRGGFYDGANTIGTSGYVLSSTGAITNWIPVADGSATNELQTIANTSNSTSHTATLSNSGGSMQIIEGPGVLLTTGGTGLNGTLTIEAIDPSTTNEIQTYSASGAGPTSYDMTVSSGGTVTLAEGAGIDLTRSTNTITIASTGITSATGYINGGNSFGGAATIGLNDNFDWSFETNGTNRMWIDNSGPVSIGATQLTTAALNINGLQNGIGQLIAGGSGLVTPSFYQATGSGSGSTATVFSGVISMLNGNVEALIQNTSTSGTGGVVMQLNAKTATGDPRLYMTIDGTTDWSIGIDNDDVDNLKIHRFAAPSDNNGVGTMELGYDGTSLGVAINKTGIGTAANAHYGLDVGGKVRGDQFVNNNPTSFTTGTIALGTAAGTGPTLDTGVSEFWGNGGRLKFTSGTSPTANGIICTVTLGTEYTFEECAPIMQGRTTNTGGFDYVGTFNSGTRVITYTLIGTLAASTAYEFNLIVSGHN